MLRRCYFQPAIGKLLHASAVLVDISAVLVHAGAVLVHANAPRRTIILTSWQISDMFPHTCQEPVRFLNRLHPEAPFLLNAAISAV